VRAARGKRIETNTIERLNRLPEALEPARSLNRIAESMNYHRISTNC
jgi:hypothetical protein